MKNFIEVPQEEKIILVNIKSIAMVRPSKDKGVDTTEIIFSIAENGRYIGFVAGLPYQDVVKLIEEANR